MRLRRSLPFFLAYEKAFRVPCGQENNLTLWLMGELRSVKTRLSSRDAAVGQPRGHFIPRRADQKVWGSNPHGRVLPTPAG
jgi:hypothetical protein